MQNVVAGGLDGARTSRPVQRNANRAFVVAVVAVSGLFGLARAASAAPVYLGLQETGVNGGAITQEAEADGSASFTNVLYGDSNDGYFLLSASATGTPPLPEPELISNSVSATASHPGTISVYVTETNQNPNKFEAFESIFGSSLIGAGVTVVESSYVHECAVPGNACTAADVFATTTLLSTTTFTSTGSVTDYSSNGLPFASVPYATTEVYRITFTQDVTSTTDSITLNGVPEPASLALLGAAVFGLGAVRRRSGVR